MKILEKEEIEAKKNSDPMGVCTPIIFVKNLVVAQLCPYVPIII